MGFERREMDDNGTELNVAEGVVLVEWDSGNLKWG